VGRRWRLARLDVLPESGFSIPHLEQHVFHLFYGLKYWSLYSDVIETSVMEPEKFVLDPTFLIAPEPDLPVFVETNFFNWKKNS
jgi:hypothetical protein